MSTGTKGKGRMMAKTLIVAVALIARSTDAGMAQDVAKGEISFKKCVICHSIGPGAQNKVGPAQNGLDGRKAGAIAGVPPVSRTTFSERARQSGDM